MKKIIPIVLTGLILAGCSSNDVKHIENKTQASIEQTSRAKDSETAKETSIAKETTAVSQKAENAQKKETLFLDTGISIKIPNTWSPGKYKIYNDGNSILFEYTGEKTIPFLCLILHGKKGTDTPDVGMKAEYRTVDNWVFLVMYSFQVATVNSDVRKNAPSEYYDMADSIQEILSSIKIVDNSKVEQWFNKYDKSETTGDMQEKSGIKMSETKQKYSIDDVKRAFGGKNDGFKYNYDGFNENNMRYMVSTDAEGHAAIYRYEVDLNTGDVYNDRNEIIDRLDNGKID